MSKYVFLEELDDGSDLPGDRGDETALDTTAADTAKAEADAAAVKAEADAAAVKAEADAAAARTAADKIMIPKSRLDVKNREIERLRKELATRDTKAKETDKGADKTPVKDQLSALNKDLAAAMKDGKTDLFLELQEKRDALLMEHVTSTTSEATGKASVTATESMRLDNTIDLIEQKFPELNMESDAFDQDLTDEVMELYETLASSDKYKPADALARAVQLITGKDLKAAAGVDTKKTADKKKTDIDKNLEAAKKLGVDASKNGKDSDKAGMGDDIKASKLSWEEFEALPETTKARLRGDDVVAA